jgi:predicted dehydrogenase
MKRRDFLKGCAGGAAAGFTIVPRHVLGGVGYTAPSEIVNLAVIGTGGQGIVNIKGLRSMDDVRIIAVSDVNEQSDYSDFYYGGVAGFKPAMELINEHYGAKETAYEGCRLHKDYRQMFDKEKNLDAVLIATHDTMHAPPILAAIENGKHVYCEKPLTHSIYEVRKVAEAARKSPVKTQMGNHGHSGEGIRLTVEWIRDGAIGDVRQVDVWTHAGGEWGDYKARPTDKPATPKGFDWDLWLGPAQYRDYHSAYAPYNWRGWWEFGTGAIGDMGSHNMDPAVWALDLDLPERIESSSTGTNDETTPKGSMVHYKFAAKGDRPAVNMTWYDGGLLPKRPEILERGRRMGTNGILFKGDKGMILCGGWGGSPRIIPEAEMRKYKLPAKTIRRTKGHRQDWIDAIKNDTQASANFEYSAHLTEIVLLGTLSLRTGMTIEWDASAMKAKNLPTADPFIRPEFRPGWLL